MMPTSLLQVLQEIFMVMSPFKGILQSLAVPPFKGMSQLVAAMLF